MSGVRLESRVYVITAYAQAVQGLRKSCEQAGIEVLDMVFGPVAAAGVALTAEEIRKGAVLVDIGGGTTDIAQFRDGVPVHASVLGIGGLHITNDLAVCLNLGAEDAEKIKQEAGAISYGGMQRHETSDIGLPGETARKISMQQIVSIIRARCEELFELVRNEIAVCRLQGSAPVSVVLTGGTALLKEIAGLAAPVLGIPARVGLPQGVPGIQHGMKSPSYAAAIGLLMYAHQRGVREWAIDDTEESLLGRLKDRFIRFAGYRDFLEKPNKEKKGVSYV
jgi:cell division protein FtsA